MTMPDTRNSAVELVLAAFHGAAPQRVNTPPAVTMAQGMTALYTLGVTSREVQIALSAMGLPVPEWCGREQSHTPHFCRTELCMGEAAAPVRDDGHVLLVHAPGECPEHNGEYSRSCMFCDGGLSACTRCGAFEGAWPDQCPGAQMTYEQSEQVHTGRLNYRLDAWREDECCQVMRPTYDTDAYLTEHGYQRDETGRWVKT